MNKPVEKFRDGTLSVSIWANVVGDKVFYTTQLENRYLDKESEEWKESDRFTQVELLQASRLLTRAHDKISDLRAG